MKRCTTCGEEKEEAEYYKRHARCKVCYNKANKEARVVKYESQEANVKKQCISCGEENQVSDFYIGQSRCKECHKNAMREYYSINHEKILIREKEYRKNHQEEIKNNNTKYREKIKNDDTLLIKKRYLSLKSAKRAYKCAKVLCGKLKAPVLEMICPVCGVHFGRIKSQIDYDYKRGGRDGLGSNGTYYCSKDCQHVGLMKKRWQEKSPYAKNIKRIKREHGLW